MGKKPIIIIWDHFFHQKTKSFDFLEDILKEHYEIIRVWDYSSKGGERPDIREINSIKPYCIIFAQKFPPPIILKKIYCLNKIWLPMYDSISSLRLVSLLKYMGIDIKIISFSYNVHSQLKKIWPYVLYLQYYPKPMVEDLKDDWSKKIKVFFWQRIEKINWELVKKLIDPAVIDTLYFRILPDPGHAVQKMPDKEDIVAYNIKFVEGWLSKDEYINLLKSCDVFIAPRPREGIGHTYLEAMACGLCVVSPNWPTANEYITSEKNGILYKLGYSKRIDLSRAITYGNDALESVRQGRARWDTEKNKILDFIEVKISKWHHFFRELIYRTHLNYVRISNILSEYKKDI